VKRLTVLFLVPLAAIALAALPAVAKPLCLNSGSLNLFLKKVATKKGRFGPIDGVSIGGGSSRRPLTGAYAVAPDGGLVSISLSIGSVSVSSDGAATIGSNRSFYELRWDPDEDMASGRFISIGLSTDSDPVTLDVVDCKDVL